MVASLETVAQVVHDKVLFTAVVVPFLNDEIELLSLVIDDKCPLIDTNLISIHELFQENSNSEKNLRASIMGISRKLWDY